MIIGKKALVGFLGLGAAAAALGWMLLPKNSKIRKVIAGKAKEMGGIFKDHIDEVISVTADKKQSQTVSSRNK